MEKQKEEFKLRIPLGSILGLESANEIAVVMSILSFSDNGKNNCWASVREIAGRAKCSKTEASRVMKKFLASGVLEKLGRKKCLGGYTNILKLSVPQADTSEAKKREKNTLRLSVPTRHEAKCPKRKHIIHINNTYKERIYKKESNLVSLRGEYSTPKSLTEADLVEIATKYRVPLVIVKLCREKMINWCEAKGKTYKNYKRALMNWVLSEAQKMVERRGQDDRKRGIDARHIA